MPTILELAQSYFDSKIDNNDGKIKIIVEHENICFTIKINDKFTFQNNFTYDESINLDYVIIIIKKYITSIENVINIINRLHGLTTSSITNGTTNWSFEYNNLRYYMQYFISNENEYMYIRCGRTNTEYDVPISDLKDHLKTNFSDIYTLVGINVKSARY